MNTQTLEPLLEGFRQGISTPTSPLERLTFHIEAALDCARDSGKPEDERMKELWVRIELMQHDDD